jgi:hypothetical protein
MPMTEEHKKKMAEGRARAKAEGRMGGGKRATTPVTETPEFKAAVESAATEILARMLATQGIEAGVVANATAPAPSTADDPMKLFRGIAMAMAEVADQGTDRKRVAPEILEQRAVAAKRMMELITRARERGDVPIYQLKNKVQLYIENLGPAVVEPIWRGNDKIHYPTEIESFGVPNLSFVPINAAAEEIFAAFVASIGTTVIEHDLDPALGLTAGGVVVRGAAAQVLFRSTGRPEMPLPNLARDDMAGIRRNQPAQTKDVRVLGSIHPPARQNA